jgi:dihydrofolate reductase
MTVFHAQLAVSLDMRIARADGGVDWLDGFPPEEFGFDAFLDEVDAILMGRGTCDALRGFGDWPHGAPHGGADHPHAGRRAPLAPSRAAARSRLLWRRWTPTVTRAPGWRAAAR